MLSILVILGIRKSIFATEYSGDFSASFFSIKHSYMRQTLFAVVAGLMFFAN